MEVSPAPSGIETPRLMPLVMGFCSASLPALDENGRRRERGADYLGDYYALHFS